MQVKRQYALKQIFMRIEFENSIRRLSILSLVPDIKIAWINPCSNNHASNLRLPNEVLVVKEEV